MFFFVALHCTSIFTNCTSGDDGRHQTTSPQGCWLPNYKQRATTNTSTTTAEQPKGVFENSGRNRNERTNERNERHNELTTTTTTTDDTAEYNLWPSACFGQEPPPKATSNDNNVADCHCGCHCYHPFVTTTLIIDCKEEINNWSNMFNCTQWAKRYIYICN